MNDSTQAIYDAVRSRIGNADVGYAIESAMRDVNFSHYAEMAMHAATQAAGAVELEMRRPAVLFRPSLYIDGNQWCALYGANIQEGVAGFGDSPELAMQDFDRNWRVALPATRGEAP